MKEFFKKIFFLFLLPSLFKSLDPGLSGRRAYRKLRRAKRHRRVEFLLLFITVLPVFSQPIRYEDKLRIREAIDIRSIYGDSIWQGISKTPFTMLLVMDSTEYLIDHPDVPAGFYDIGYDTVLKTNIYKRDRVFDINLLAAFPAVNGVNTIVAGIPENSERTSSEWIISLLHEHFHLYTFNSKDYNIELEKLGLRGDDASGMWMLNYPFPYEEQTVIDKYNAYAGAFYNWLLSYNIRESDLNDSEKILLLDMLRYRTELMNVINSSNYAYMSFQHWQEGVARYTEYKYLELIKDRVPYPGVSSLHDFISYDSLMNKQWNRLLGNLSDPQLAEKKRVMFYYSGMAEALLLDKLAPGWRDKYLKDKFFLFEYY